jgi:isopenicillin-N N-acyltransferase-like protein
MPNIYPLFTATGSARDLGHQHGEQAASRIDGYLDFLAASLKISRDELRARASKFMPLFERDCPQLIDEIHGLAEGAKLDFADALAAQLRGELGPVADGACTSFAIGPAATANGETIVGQTSDNPPELMDFGYTLRVTPDDGRPAFVMWTFGGMLGYFGVNTHGVCHFANSLGGGPKWKFALAHYPLKRLIFEQTNLDEVQQLMRRFPVCSNGNYMLGDDSGAILDVEMTSDGPFLLDNAGKDFLVHSNHYLCSEHACDENFEHSLPDSFFRLDRMTELIREKAGSITVDDVKTMLADHGNYPTGVCRHPGEGTSHVMLDANGCTVAAIIVEPMQGKLHVARGNACENEFVEHSVVGCQ